MIDCMQAQKVVANPGVQGHFIWSSVVDVPLKM
jgi:hypothetical protein